MHRFWEEFLLPVARGIEPRVVWEVRSEQGGLTPQLLAFCAEAGAVAHIVDPSPGVDLAALKDRHGGADSFRRHPGRALELLDGLPAPDLVLIDGDRNWHTVVSELRLTESRAAQERRPLPVVAVGGVDWPYGRRDAYDDPEAIPADQRQPYARSGVRPDARGLSESGINAGVAHASVEGGERNGVLTAVEDFLSESGERWDLEMLPGFGGLALLIPVTRSEGRPALARAVERWSDPDVLRRHARLVEHARIEADLATEGVRRSRRALEQDLDTAEEEKQALEREVGRLRAHGEATEREARQARQTLLQIKKEIATIGGSRAWRYGQRLGRGLRGVLRRGSPDIVDPVVSALDAIELLGSTGSLALPPDVTEARRHELGPSDLRPYLPPLAHELELAEAELTALEEPAPTDGESPARARVTRARAAIGAIARAMDGERPRPPSDGFVPAPDAWAELLHDARHDLEVRGPREALGAERLEGEAPADANGSSEVVLDAPRRRVVEVARALAAVEAATPASGVDDHRAADVFPLPAVTVLVPVYNAHDDVERCLAALVRNTGGPARLLVIDDASPDPRIAPLLERYADHANVTVVCNSTNLGFTATVNRGLELTTDDVVLLNSDTEVTPRWLERLAATAASADDIGSVTAVSNHAGAFSVPEIAVDNPVPAGLDRDQVGRLVAQSSLRLAPETPTGNGFCMYLKRSMISEVGLLDLESFPRGYGEENDYSMRALNLGWRHVVDDATFVFHRREASFGADKAEIAQRARARLSELHPDYTRVARAFSASPQMAEARARTATAFASPPPAGVHPRILFVIHAGTGGTPATNRDLMARLGDRYECFLFTSDRRTLRLWRQTTAGLEEVESWRLARVWEPMDFSRADYAAIARHVLVRYEIELVHVRHMFNHTFDLPHLAASLAIPVVFSFHDYYLCCPTVHMIDNEGRFCGGHCTPGDGSCFVGMRALEALPHLKHGWVHRWKAEAAQMLETASAAVTASEFAHDVHLRTLPVLRRTRFEVIEHGRDLQQAEGIAVAPSPERPVRIVVPGNFDVHKGGDFLVRLLAEDSAGRLEFHFLGAVAEQFSHLGVQHGPYERESFNERLREIAPSFVGLLSVAAETYSHTLTEAWGAGVPVLATSIGAPPGRLREHGGGWSLPVDDPAAAYRRIVEIVDDPEEYRREAERATLAGIPTVATMAEAYGDLYRSVLESGRAFQRPGADPRPPRRRSDPTRLEAFVAGELGRFPVQTHVRVLRRLEHPAIQGTKLRAQLAAELHAGALSPAADVALVESGALSPTAIDTFLERCARTGTPLVLDVAGELPAAALAPSNGSVADGLGRLLEAAAVVTVSAEGLREPVSAHARGPVVVVPDALDERLWLEGRELDGPTEPSGAGTLRLVHLASPDHPEDLAFLRPVVERLRNDAGIDAELAVVGGHARDADDSWSRHVPVAAGQPYPRLVRWLQSQRRDWDVAVFPVADPRRPRSDLRFLELSALGVPGVYGEAAYDACLDGVSGLRAGDSVEQWCAALSRLAAEPELRARLAEAARDYVFSQRCIAHSAAGYLDLVCGVAIGSAPEREAVEHLREATVPRTAARGPVAVGAGSP